MGNQSKGSIHLTLGVAASKVKQITTHRYCHHCLEEQYREYGEFFWSRVWYIQGANCCSKHKVKLSEFLQPAHLNGRHQFIPASFILNHKQSHNPAHELDLIVSRHVDELLNLPPTTSRKHHSAALAWRARQSPQTLLIKHISTFTIQDFLCLYA